MDGLIKSVEALGTKWLGAEGEDSENVKTALKVGQDALATASRVLKAIERGDQQDLQTQLTQWEDVNRTWAAVKAMDEAIEDAKAGVQLREVLEVVGTVLRIAVSLSAVAL